MVKANARQEKVARGEGGELLLWVRAPAREGRANKAVVELLSRYLGVPKSRIAVLKGQTARNKIIDVS